MNKKQEAVAKLKEFCNSLVGLYKNSADRIKQTQFRNFNYSENFHIEYDQINHKKWLIHFVLFALRGLCILLQPPAFLFVLNQLLDMRIEVSALQSGVSLLKSHT